MTDKRDTQMKMSEEQFNKMVAAIVVETGKPEEVVKKELWEMGLAVPWNPDFGTSTNVPVDISPSEFVPATKKMIDYIHHFHCYVLRSFKKEENWNEIVALNKEHNQTKKQAIDAGLHESHPDLFIDAYGPMLHSWSCPNGIFLRVRKYRREMEQNPDFKKELENSIKEHEDQETVELKRLIEEMRKGFENVPVDELEQEIDKALADVRKEINQKTS